ncbi:MAG TPA: hypothetical protein VF624_03535 [Tepidisphaeraceae bacterium]|jgi:hypothetical protein
MNSARIGQILSRLVPLSDHDVEEILHEQKSSRLRFGEAALALGFARPGDVWSAWCEQRACDGGEVDLDAIGVDAQATRCVTPAAAWRHRAVAVRVSGLSVVVASDRVLDENERASVAAATSLRVVFVQAAPHQIDTALRRYYALATTAA